MTTIATFRGLDLAHLQNRIKTQPWAAGIYNGVRKAAEPLIARGVTIFPADQPSGWKHNFVCPNCAILLEFDLDSPEAHRCGLCGGTFSNTRLNEAWVYEYNQLMISAAEDACLMCALEGDAKAGEWARGVLLGYAEAYAGYAPHGSHAGKGKIQAQSLDESVWMLPAVRVYQSLRDLKILDEAGSAIVREKLFAPAIELLRPQTTIVHNIHLWNASAIWAMAVELGDTEAREFAEGHIALNITEGVLPDGSWYEGSPHYHFYSIDAFVSYLLAARIAGQKPVMAEQLGKMFSSPLLLLTPQWEFPAFNDGWPRNPLTGRAAIYELAEYLFGGYQPALHTIYHLCGAERSSKNAMLFGPDTIAEGELEFPRLAVVDGIAVIRHKSYSGYVKATPHGGGHDHNDKPAFYICSANGNLNAVDLGNPGYGNPLHGEYFRRTHSHNTILVGDQNHANSNARILSAEEHPDYVLVASLDDEAYPGAEIRRWTCFGDNWVIDRAKIVCPEARDLLWLFHADGTLESADPLEWKEGNFTANSHFAGQRLAPLGLEGSSFVWKSKSSTDQWKMVLRVNGEAQVGRAVAPSLPATDSVSVLAVKFHGPTLDVSAVLLLAEDAPEIRISTYEQGGVVAAVDSIQVKLG